MRTREFWTLDGDDRETIARLAAGLGEGSARVLAYLLLRAAFEDGPATELELRIGTELNRSAVASAVDRLETVGVVKRTAIRDEGPGRPPTAWEPTTDLDAARRTVYRHHATTLLERAVSYGDRSRGTEGNESSEGNGLTLGLNWRPNGLHLPFYAAKAGNEYEAAGLSIGIDHHEGSHRSLDAVLSGASDVGLVGAATVLRAREAGEPIVPVAVVYQRAMAVLYTVRERFGEPLTGVSQLRGRRIGMPARSETRVLGRLFLNQVALDDAVEIVDTAGEEQDALLSGEVDVVTGAVSDPRQLERRGMTVDTLAVADHFPIYGPTLVVREGTLSERSEALEGFLAGTTAGWVNACFDPMPAATLIAEESDSLSERSARTFEHAYETFGGSEAVSENGWGWQREATWDRLRAALTQGTLLSESEPAG